MGVLPTIERSCQPLDEMRLHTHDTAQSTASEVRLEETIKQVLSAILAHALIPIDTDLLLERADLSQQQLLLVVSALQLSLD